MLLKELRLQNFRQYKGIQTIRFATDPERNVTVILGDNTYGKTTLLQAFNWCFYEKILLDYPDDLLNYDVADAMVNGETQEVEVEIQLVHNNIDYTLTRTRKYSKVGSDVRPAPPTVSMSYMNDDGQTAPVKVARIDEVIKSILPEDLSTYFFFDTERVANVSTRKDLGSSVKGLLGLTVLENAIRHLGSKSQKRSVLGKLHNDMDDDTDQQAKMALKKCQDAQDRREIIKAQLAECDSQIAQLKSQKDQYDSLLRQHNDTRERKARMDTLEADVKRDTAALDRTVTALRRDFWKNSLRFFAVPLIDEAERLLKDAKVDDKGVRDLTQPTLQEILDRGTCICGLKFSEHPDAAAHVKEEMGFCPPESIGNSVRNYRGILNRFRGDLEGVLQGMRDRRANIYLTTDRIQESNDEIDTISKEIQDLPDLAKYESARNDIKRQLAERNRKRDGFMREDGERQSEIERYQKIYDKCAAATGRNKQVFIQISYAEEIARWLKEEYDKNESEIRDALEDRVNDIFEKMYHGRRRVVISPNYDVNLLTDLNDTTKHTGESEGLNRVKSFAFIAGLVSLAREKVITKAGDEEFDLSSEPYPLVMDAPFSNTDETHIANISRVLPQASEQVIMFVMMKDWRYAQPVLNDRLGASYQLDKRSEQYSVLQEA